VKNAFGCRVVEGKVELTAGSGKSLSMGPVSRFLLNVTCRWMLAVFERLCANIILKLKRSLTVHLPHEIK